MLASSSRVFLRTATAMGGRTAVKALAARAASSSASFEAMVSKSFFFGILPRRPNANEHSPS